MWLLSPNEGGPSADTDVAATPERECSEVLVFDATLLKGLYTVAYVRGLLTQHEIELRLYSEILYRSLADLLSTDVG